MTWTNEDDAMMRESMRAIQEHEDAIGALNEAVLHEPEPICREDELATLRARVGFFKGSAENWCNRARENFRLYKKWKSSLFVVAFWGLVGWVTVILK